MKTYQKLEKPIETGIGNLVETYKTVKDNVYALRNDLAERMSDLMQTPLYVTRSSEAFVGMPNNQINYGPSISDLLYSPILMGDKRSMLKQKKAESKRKSVGKHNVIIDAKGKTKIKKKRNGSR